MKSTTALAMLFSLSALPAFAVERADVVTTYANIAEATYADSLTAARNLRAKIEALADVPSPETLEAARTVWVEARVPYMQTEAFRFGNPIVDEWEGKVNAWPLDEGLIDYVDPSYGGATDENEYAVLNVIANPTFTLAGKEIAAYEITPDLLENTLQEADEVESNVATGYHAIEFLLWGQDLNGTDHGAGARAWTDFAQGEACTNGNCDRRVAYLKAATDLLISDLEYMSTEWADGGDARANVMADADAGISAMLTGLGSLSYGELAGERMKLGVMLNDPEEEHDCFSDNTHNSHFYDGIGMRNVFHGSYVRLDGSVVSGASLADLLDETAPDVGADLSSKIDGSVLALLAIKTAAEAGLSYDQMLARDNAGGEALILGAVDALVVQTRAIERAVTALGANEVTVEGSDSLDDPDAVFE